MDQQTRYYYYIPGGVLLMISILLCVVFFGCCLSRYYQQKHKAEVITHPVYEEVMQRVQPELSNVVPNQAYSTKQC